MQHKTTTNSIKSHGKNKIKKCVTSCNKPPPKVKWKQTLAHSNKNKISFRLPTAHLNITE